jgi:hypothetical protein
MSLKDQTVVILGGSSGIGRLRRRPPSSTAPRWLSRYKDGVLLLGEAAARRTTPHMVKGSR